MGMCEVEGLTRSLDRFSVCITHDPIDGCEMCEESQPPGRRVRVVLDLQLARQ